MRRMMRDVCDESSMRVNGVLLGLKRKILWMIDEEEEGCV